MHHIHLKDIHAPHGPNLYALSLGEAACSALALVFFLISWAVGGDEFMSSIGGSTALAVLVALIVLGGLFAMLTKPEES